MSDCSSSSTIRKYKSHTWIIPGIEGGLDGVFLFCVFQFFSLPSKNDANFLFFFSDRATMPKSRAPKKRTQRHNNDPLVKKPGALSSENKPYNIHRDGVRFRDEVRVINYI